MGNLFPIDLVIPRLPITNNTAGCFPPNKKQKHSDNPSPILSYMSAQMKASQATKSNYIEMRT